MSSICLSQSQSGQSLVEASLGLMLALTASVLFSCALLAVTHSMILHHELYEAALCTQTYPLKENCESEFRKKIEKSVFFSKIKSLKIRTSQSLVEAELSIQSPLLRTWTLSESINLPLSDTKAARL